MSHLQVVVFSVTLLFLIVLSAFFSAAETGLMAINRYRLRHKARLKKRSAILILKLLERPDRLLGMILIGNNCANICASALATLLAINLFGEKTVIFSTILLTIAILVFAEVAPKTLAALYPDRVSKIVIWPVYGMLMAFYPIVWLLNVISNGLLGLFGVSLARHSNESLSREELRSMVYETSGRISHQYQSMLLGILDLNTMLIDDVMIPQHEVQGIDLESDWSLIQQQLAKSDHDWLPVYRENINKIAGLLHLRDVIAEAILGSSIDKEKLLTILHEPYFVPEGTTLNVQLLHFQQQRRRVALVVDEYGEIRGLITLEDILEEIVGKFTTTVANAGKEVKRQKDGSFLVHGAITIRELNRVTQYELPTEGPRTLNGLIVEYLEATPRAGVCVLIGNHPVEIIEVKDNHVKLARVFGQLKM